MSEGFRMELSKACNNYFHPLDAYKAATQDGKHKISEGLLCALKCISFATLILPAIIGACKLYLDRSEKAQHIDTVAQGRFDLQGESHAEVVASAPDAVTTEPRIPREQAKAQRLASRQAKQEALKQLDQLDLSEDTPARIKIKLKGDDAFNEINIKAITNQGSERRYVTIEDVDGQSINIDKIDIIEIIPKIVRNIDTGSELTLELHDITVDKDGYIRIPEKFRYKLSMPNKNSYVIDIFDKSGKNVLKISTGKSGVGKEYFQVTLC